MRRRLALSWFLAACSTPAPPAPSAPPAPAPAPGSAASVPAPRTCTALPFEASTPVPEASGAAWLSDDRLLVISDSGNDGAYAIVDSETGATVEQGTLPLGDPKVTGEDLEGIAVANGKVHVLTGAGWARTYERRGAGFALVDGPYSIGPVDLADEKLPDGATGMVCPGNHGNCGRDYEGLCLAPDPTGSPCAGFAAAKADGRLYCLHLTDGRLAIDPAISIVAAKQGKTMADCAFSPTGELYVGSNAFDLGRVYQVHDWRTPAAATVTLVDAIGLGFPETLAVRGDVFYRMSDMGGSPSLSNKFRCR